MTTCGSTAGHERDALHVSSHQSPPRVHSAHHAGDDRIHDGHWRVHQGELREAATQSPYGVQLAHLGQRLRVQSPIHGTLANHRSTGGQQSPPCGVGTSARGTRVRDARALHRDRGTQQGGDIAEVHPSLRHQPRDPYRREEQEGSRTSRVHAVHPGSPTGAQEGPDNSSSYNSEHGRRGG